MKRSQKQEWRQKSPAELQAVLVGKAQELVKTRFKLAQGQLKNVHLAAKIRNEIAVIKTILSEKRVKP